MVSLRLEVLAPNMSPEALYGILGTLKGTYRVYRRYISGSQGYKGLHQGPMVSTLDLGFRDHACAHCSMRDAPLERPWKAISLIPTPSEAVKPCKSTPSRT